MDGEKMDSFLSFSLLSFPLIFRILFLFLYECIIVVLQWGED